MTVAHEHTFAYENDPRPGQRSMCCTCGTYLNEHAPGHPYGVSAGPRGMFARFCLVDGCDWRNSDAGYVSTVAFLLAVIVGAMLFLALWAGGQRAVCWMNDDAVRYCPGYTAGEAK